jgi:ABC-2 type transport system ATP-binding protein
LVEFESFDDIEPLRNIAGVEAINRVMPSTFSISVKGGVDVRPEIFRFATEHKLSLVGLRQEENSLENIFRELTAKKEA